MSTIRENLLQFPLERRAGLFTRQILSMGLCMKEKNGLYSVTNDREGCPPLGEWRLLANTILTLDDDSLPSIVSCGPPEVYPPLASSMQRVLWGMAEGRYRIEPILFGTVCWLYHYHGEWLLATKHSPNAGGVHIRKGGPSLIEAFEEALSHTVEVVNSTQPQAKSEFEPPALPGPQSQAKPAFETQPPVGPQPMEGRSSRLHELESRLDPDCSYGFVLHHHLLHVFTYEEFSTRLWHISTVFNASSIVQTDCSIGIPHPPVIFLPSNDGHNGEKVRELCVDCSRSLTDGSIHNFGFVLRGEGSSDECLGKSGVRATMAIEESNLVVKSPLHFFIERHIGRIVPLRSIVAQLLFSPIEERELFSRVFPSLGEMISMASAQVTRLSRLIVEFVSNGRNNLYDTIVGTDNCMIPSLMRAVMDVWKQSPRTLSSRPGQSSGFVRSRRLQSRDLGGIPLPTEVEVRNILLRPIGMARPLVIQALTALLPSEEGRMDKFVTTLNRGQGPRSKPGLYPGPKSGKREDRLDDETTTQSTTESSVRGGSRRVFQDPLQSVECASSIATDELYR